MRITDMIIQDDFFLILFYRLLPTTSVGNEQGKQMKIQIQILGLKGLKSAKYETYETFKQMMIMLYDFSMAVNQNISEKEA